MLVGWGVFGVVVVAIFLLGLGNGTIILDAATFMMLLAAAPGAFIAVVSLNDKLGSKNRGYTVAGVLCVALFALGFMMRGPVETPSHDALEETSQTEENDSVVDEDYDYGFDPESVLGDQEQPISDSAPSGGGPRRVPRYEDERGPTTAPELTSVPDDQRWYNAQSHMGTTCTVVGPVVDVYQAVDEAGDVTQHVVVEVARLDPLELFEERGGARVDGLAWKEKPTRLSASQAARWGADFDTSRSP